MRLRTGIRTALLCAVLLAPVGVAPPAQAHRDVCTGIGDMSTGPIYYPTLGPSVVGWFFIVMPDACFFGISDFTATGSFLSLPGLENYCFNMRGTGVANGDHAFTFSLSGTTMTFAGGVAGTLQWTPNALRGQSCTSGATDFIVAGTLALV